MKELSCYRMGKRGTHDEFFAVPAENYCSGAVTGIKVFREVLDAMKAEDSGHAVILWRILADMGAALNENGKSRHGAAATIAHLMTDALLYFSKNANVEQWLDAKLDQAEKDKVYWNEKEAKEKAEFVQRMKAAKQARSAAKANDALCASMTV